MLLSWFVVGFCLVQCLKLRIHVDDIVGAISAESSTLFLLIILKHAGNIPSLLRLLKDNSYNLGFHQNLSCLSWDRQIYESVRDALLGLSQKDQSLLLSSACVSLFPEGLLTEQDWDNNFSDSFNSSVPCSLLQSNESHYIRSWNSIDCLDKYGYVRLNLSWPRLEWSSQIGFFGYYLNNFSLHKMIDHWALSGAGPFEVVLAKLLSQFANLHRSDLQVVAMVGLTFLLRKSQLKLYIDWSNCKVFVSDCFTLTTFYEGIYKELLPFLGGENLSSIADESYTPGIFRFVTFNLFSNQDTWSGEEIILKVRNYLQTCDEYNYLRMMESIFLANPKNYCPIVGDEYKRLEGIGSHQNVIFEILACFSDQERISYFRRWERRLPSQEIIELSHSSALTLSTRKVIDILTLHVLEKPVKIYNNPADQVLSQWRIGWGKILRQKIGPTFYIGKSSSKEATYTRILQNYLVIDIILRLHFDTDLEWRVDPAWIKMILCGELPNEELSQWFFRDPIFKSAAHIAYNIICITSGI